MFAQHLDPVTGENEMDLTAAALAATAVAGRPTATRPRGSRPTAPCWSATRTTPPPGAASAATSPARAARARSTSTATAATRPEAIRHCGDAAGHGLHRGRRHRDRQDLRHVGGAGGCGRRADVRALKPVASGVPPVGDPGFADSDTARLLAAQGVAVTESAVEACSPWRYAAPLAPTRRRRSRATRWTYEVVAWCLERMEAERYAADRRRRRPDEPRHPGGDRPRLALVAGLPRHPGLRQLSRGDQPRAHGLRDLPRRRRPVLAIVVNESPGAPTPPETVAEAIARHVEVPVIVIARDAPCPDALAALV